MSNLNPIGIFDSGVGGISVMKEVRHLLPQEDIIYFSDSAYCPYGTKTQKQIRNRILKITQLMLKHQAKLIVAACNTASIAGLDYLRHRFSLPIVGMEPAIKPAARITKNGRIGVMATDVTINGHRFQSLVGQFAKSVEVVRVPCPGLVEKVEQGLIDDPQTIDLLQKYLMPMINKKVDTVVLGCTHYPFLRSQVELLMGPNVQVLDTGSAVAKRVAQVLKQQNLLNNNNRKGEEFFFTSGAPDQVGLTVSKLWPYHILKLQQVDF